MSNPDPVVPNTAPFAPEEVQWLNGFISGLQPAQLTWLEGFLSGMRAGQGVAAAAAPTATAPAALPELTILYGSESGNAESLADQTAKAAESSGFKAKVLNMGDIKPAKLKGVENLLVLVSTWGEGDPPENAIDFYEGFMGNQAPKLKDTRFSVLSLGDTSYENF
jgi:sulfite reductase (NADPH) flavoprotein alpha-component